MRYYDPKRRDNPGDFFPMPKAVFRLGLDYGEITLLAFATHAMKGGVDAKTLSGLLGHTDASFTLDTYTHVTSDMQKNASDVVGRMMQNFMRKE